MLKNDSLLVHVGLRIQSVFHLFVGVSAVVSPGAIAAAPKITKVPAASVKQISDLQYPEYPKELIERIKGAPAKLKAVAAPNWASDPALSREWGLASIGFFDALAQQLVLPTTKTAPKCGKEVVVAVVDTGIDYTHPELRENLWVNPGETGTWEPTKEQLAKGISPNCHDKSCNGLDDDNDGYADDVIGWDFVHDVPLPYDTHGHGTHIAGIINGAAGTNLDSGTCPRITVMALKYYDNGGAGYNNLANTVRAIEFAVNHGAQIINYSGGGADPAASEREAIAEAHRKGVLFVAAAGNDGRNNDHRPYFPASYPLDNIISVASVNKYERLLPSSNFGKSVHVGAPGLMILSTLPGGKFGTMSGTSQATAFVTGVAALLAAQAGPTSFDYKKIKNWVIAGARAMPLNGAKTLVSGGLLSLPGSLQSQRADVVKTAIATAKPTVPEVAALPAASRTQTR